MNVFQVVADASEGQIASGIVAALCLVVAVFASFRERRRATRHDPDAVGWVDWTNVQMLALITLAGALLVLAKG